MADCRRNPNPAGKHSARGKSRGRRAFTNEPNYSVAVTLTLEGPLWLHADVLSLLGQQHGQLGAELFQVQTGDLLVEVLGPRRW